METKLLIDLSKKGNVGSSLPKCDVPGNKLEDLFPPELLRGDIEGMPEVSEPEVVRHFVNLSVKNHHVDKDFYPLGSCTMKYNPKINDAIAAMTDFSELHPLQPAASVQGALQILYEVQEALCKITGMKDFTLQPVAGSHGELTGVMVMRNYHKSRGNEKKYILIPDSAHGTNPASVVIGGYSPITVRSTAEGLVDLDDLKSKITSETAGFMLTNPNTLGIFEENVMEIARLIHEVDGLMYMDGANMNALLGIVRPADMGFDITHINLHKTFSTPHGGGGPGSGPIGVTEKLQSFLPRPHVKKTATGYILDNDRPDSLGRVHGFFGNFGVVLRAWAYIRTLGEDGLKAVSRHAIVNANYLRARLDQAYDLPYTRRTMHEIVFSGDRQKKNGVKTLDIAKRLLDFGIHAPTVYFPLIVSEALMIEPTETESRETLDRFADIMIQIAGEAQAQPELLKNAPVTTPVSRLDEGTANRSLDINWLGR